MNATEREPTFLQVEVSIRSEMTANYHMMVGGLIPGREIVSLLDEN